ncbi:MAG: MiaB/RimO family radical SAM methylthiotransferase, partial [Firmicutes bacterium]|nr:MiaB/RimO family radical SAM methylthiotransferase [Bacillota bacterium]
MPRVSIYTLGCKANQADSAALAGLFRERGYEVVEFPAPAEVYIINTCTVTHLGDKKSRQAIRRAARANPGAVVVVTGCYAQVAPEAVAGLPGVRLVVGTGDRGRLVELVEEVARTGRPRVLVGDARRRREFEELGPALYPTRVRAWVKIQEGCDNFCTYCIVPRARGPVRSRRPEGVVQEVRRLAAEGYGEVVLTGIHIGAYGRDLGDVDLAGLLRRLADLPGLKRLRLSSIEPPEVTPELIRLMAESPVICRHLHIPLQSADDRVLFRMGRRYTAEDYRRLMEAVRAQVPGVAVTTDVMVGFPGEDEEAFRRTRDFVEA